MQWILALFGCVCFVKNANGFGSLPILELFGHSGFDWTSSTTHAPISIASVYAKAVLSGNVPASHVLPDSLRLVEGGGMSVNMALPRDVINAEVNRKLLELCETPNGCDPNEADHFGLTPLHWAKYFGADAVEDTLVRFGAVPILDAAGRMPANMSYTSFRSNSKKWAKAAGRVCQIPEVHMPIDLDCRKSIQALREVRRLMFEGEPLMIRNVLPWLSRFHSQSITEVCSGDEETMANNPLPTEASANVLTLQTAQDFVNANKDLLVTVATVPYAQKFGVATAVTTLEDYFVNTSRSPEHESPPYVFHSTTTPCSEGYTAINSFMQRVDETMTNESLRLFCMQPNLTLALEDMHFYMGHTGSGAPMHVHADALNLAVAGRKQWWIVPPQEAQFRKEPVNVWRKSVLSELAEHDKPMTCEQTAGDMVYVPFDWGHAVENLSDNVFGYTLELLNQRDTFKTTIHGDFQTPPC
eukprot:m.65530 g.65530  ORF g.65530 m.65530 type:complete len:470 (+) comp23570_c0_seq1:57-1466(+)